MQFEEHLLSILFLTLALVSGYGLVRAPIIRRSFLPTGLGAGLILLLAGPQLLGSSVSEFQAPVEYYQLWAKFPKYLINVVFASLFLAKPLISLKSMWRSAGPQIAFGQMLAWGQYAIGGILTLLVLAPLFGMPNIAAALIEISFEGGHGTVAGMGPVFGELNFETGKQIATGLATASLITALVSGIALINWSMRKNEKETGLGLSLQRNQVYYHKMLAEIREKGVRVRQHLTPLRLLTHTLMIALGVGLGVGIHKILLMIEVATWAKSGVVIMGYMPVFTFCMFGGMIVQHLWSKLNLTVSRPVIDLLSGLALAVLIMTAVGTMSLEFVQHDGFVFLLLYLSGALWIILSFLLFAKKMFPRNWFQNAIISMGQSMGMTATGLLFAQMVDKDNKTGAVEAFGYKQLMFEPLVGGGIVTALSMPIIVLLGLKLFTAACVLVTVFWMWLGMRYFGRLK